MDSLPDLTTAASLPLILLTSGIPGMEDLATPGMEELTTTGIPEITLTRELLMDDSSDTVLFPEEVEDEEEEEEVEEEETPQLYPAALAVLAGEEEGRPRVERFIQDRLARLGLVEHRCR